MPTNINGYVYLTDVGGTKIKPITDLAAINMTTSNGIEVMSAGGGTIGIVPGYIESKYYNNMVSQGVGPATPQNTYVSGGTMYTLLGGYAISSEVPSINADPYKVPNEVAVRAAIDAYVATGGTDIVQGTGINVSGGAINLNIAGTDEVLTSTKTGINTLDEDEAVTPANLRGALSIGQAVDVSCAPYNNTGTITYSADGFLGGFIASMVAGTTIGYYNTGDQKFPKFAPNLKYLMIADVSGTGTVTPNGYDDVVLTETPQRIAMVVTAQDTGYISSAEAATLTVKNWRQYEVTALTSDAIQYLADYGTTPANNPVGLDPLFREANIYAAQNIRDKYLVKQDMVCPFIPVIGMTNSNLTIAAGLAYQMTITDDEDHYFTADTIPTNGYGWDSHLQLFVNDLAQIHFQPPLNLVDPLTPNAAHNITVKWRAGQANVYVDDTDVGYIITVTSGNDEGSLAYGLTTSDSGYIIFSRTTDGIPVSATVTTTLYRPVIVMGHGADTTSITGSITVTTSASNSLLFTMLTIDNMTLNGNVSATGVDFGTVTISGGTVKATGSNSVNGVVAVNGKLALDSNSILDLSENSANVPVTGTGTVAVPSGTAYVIPYGSSVAIPVTGASAGNAINKYGKCGYLVSNTSATGTNTLYDALVGGGAAYSNVIFDPALNGSAITIANTFDETVDKNIIGNGVQNTIIEWKNRIRFCAAIQVTNLSIAAADATTIAINAGNGCNATFTNCRFSYVTSDSYVLQCAYTGASMTFIGCVFDACNPQYYVIYTNQTCTITDTVFSNAKTAVDVENATTTISGSTFATTNDNITVKTAAVLTFSGTNILNSTVSGAGTVVFANNATVTSTVPEGSPAGTVGTGVIAFGAASPMAANTTRTLENITISLGTGYTNNITSSPTNASTPAELILRNVIWTFRLLGPDQHGGVITLINCKPEGVSDSRPLYAYRGRINVTGLQMTGKDIAMHTGYVVMSGENHLRKIQFSTGDVTNTVWLMSDSITYFEAATEAASIGSQTFKVGIYDTDGVTPVLGGTATVVIDGHTTHVTGTGTYINADGTTDFTVS